MDTLTELRGHVRAALLADEPEAAARLAEAAGLDDAARAAAVAHASKLVEQVRARPPAGMLESFLSEYALSSQEGVALMCLAEALLRVPDIDTIDALIEDKLAPADWAAHLDGGNAPLVNLSTLALTLTGEVLRDSGAGIVGTIRGFVQRLGEPVIRSAVIKAMKILGGQFVLGRDIDEATRVSRRYEKDGSTFSYDMLGEAARTEEDAKRYRAAYAEAIAVLASKAAAGSVRDNPGVSVKLSALHPRYEFSQRDRVMDELVERVRALALMARGANMGFNIDAEEADRLDLSLDVIAAVLDDPRLAGWDGFGVVVQAYAPRAAFVIDWLAALAEKLDRRLMVRLVKGAYWDTEIKRAQVLGLEGFPVFTHKALTDVSYIANARKLMKRADRLYPQFATHNAHTVASILAIARELRIEPHRYEFQRLHGMGEALHKIVGEEAGTRTRIYAPVGKHADLLAYLVRRLLENGANGSFVHMIADREVPAEVVAADPFSALAGIEGPALPTGPKLFGSRKNARGWDLTDPLAFETLMAERERFGPVSKRWFASSSALVSGEATEKFQIVSPADGRPVGEAIGAGAKTIELALARAHDAVPGWAAHPPEERAGILRHIADLYERNAPELFALLAREAGRVLPDAVSELREAVDFLRYYADEAERYGPRESVGVVTAISPWNFPLSIFTGQIAAALAAGNVVLAKPAEATPLIAARAVSLMYEAGVGEDVVQLLPGTGATVGAALVSDSRVNGVTFTGSLKTAKAIDQAMADNLSASAPLVAETGGVNAMVVDSTALAEQVVRDVITSAFQSAGQRCSALRVLYVQEENAPKILEMLYGAMDELRLGDPWDLSTDIGPVIDAAARERINAHIARFAEAGKLLHQVAAPEGGHFVGPAVLKIDGIADVPEEVFGPVLHVATFKAEEIDAVIEAINASAYGLTFGLHTRIDGRAAEIAARVRAGNVYVNRSQIGAVVGVQPFGGEGLSGTGPKAGGPNTLKPWGRVAETFTPSDGVNPLSGLSIGFAIAAVDQVRLAIEKVGIEPFAETLVGPTGERNTLHTWPRGVVLCLGPDGNSAREQAQLALELGNGVLVVAPGGTRIAQELGANGEPIGGLDKKLSPAAMEAGLAIDAVMHFGTEENLRPWRQAISRREGAIIPLITRPADAERLITERHISIDTTASGGNAELLAGG